MCGWLDMMATQGYWINMMAMQGVMLLKVTEEGKFPLKILRLPLMIFLYCILKQRRFPASWINLMSSPCFSFVTSFSFISRIESPIQK